MLDGSYKFGHSLLLSAVWLTILPAFSELFCLFYLILETYILLKESGDLCHHSNFGKNWLSFNENQSLGWKSVVLWWHQAGWSKWTHCYLSNFFNYWHGFTLWPLLCLTWSETVEICNEAAEKNNHVFSVWQQLTARHDVLLGLGGEVTSGHGSS